MYYIQGASSNESINEEETKKEKHSVRFLGEGNGSRRRFSTKNITINHILNYTIQ